MPLWLQFIKQIVPTADIYNATKSIIYIVLIIILARLVFWLLNHALQKVLVKRTGSTLLLAERKAKTLYPLLRSVLFYTVSFFAIINILESLGVKPTTLLAGAGILGLAVGFGAQSLVKDVISGFFVIFEDQFAVGEFIRTDKFEGIVEEIGLRVTKLRDWGGELHIIPNGTITSVTNFNRGKMRAMADINLPYDEDLEKAMEVMGRVGREMQEDYKDKIIEGPTVQGIINLGESFIVIRTTAYTHPMQQWEVERELKRRTIKALSQAGVRIPNIRKVYVETRQEEGAQ